MIKESTTGHAIDPNGVNHPVGYNRHPSGVEAIEVLRNMNYDFVTALKYIWRLEEKEGPVKNISKALWCIDDALTHWEFLDYKEPLDMDLQPFNVVMQKVLAAEPDKLLAEAMRYIWLSHWYDYRPFTEAAKEKLLELLARYQ